MEAVKFECPHCRTTVDVEATSIGEVVACPASDCGLPFEATPPSGRALDPAGQRAASDSEGSTPLAGEDLESTLFVRHPAMFRRRPFSVAALWILLVAGVLGVVGGALGFVWSPLSAVLQMWLSAVVLAAAGLTLLIWWIRVIDVTLIVTTERTTYRTGLLSKRTTEVLHDDVRNLQLDQTIVQRLFGVGDISISSSGQDDLEIVAESIPRPEEIVEVVRRHQLAG